MTRDAATMRRREREAGFTLIELLIILMIIGVLAALVIPGYSTASASARESSLADNLRHVRTQILVYTAQHGGIPPGYPEGNLSAAPTAEAFVAQMTTYTDGIGRVSASRTEVFDNGPYLRKIPANPLNLSDLVRVIPDGQTFPSGAFGPEGWVYKPATRTFVANTPGHDKSGRAYFDY